MTSMHRSTTSSAVDEISAALGDDAVIVDPDRLASYRHDMAVGAPAGTPLAVALPRTTEQVAAVLAAAHARGVPVVPRGAGSGLSGGANAVDGALVLCLEKMDAVLDVRVADGVAVVQPGVVNQRLRERVRADGLWYAPDPASRDWCTVGGNVATNAGGLCCVKYGVTRDAVLGLQVVLADGRIGRLGRRTVKGVAGYDLVGMVVGSEGTLAVVTEVTVRLRPLPPPPATVVAVFADLPSAGRAVQQILTCVTPALLEIMDRATLVAVENFQPMGLDTTAEALLIAQSDQPGGGAAAEAEMIAAAARSCGAVEVFVSDDPAEADLLLGARRLAIPAIESLGAWLLDDVAVPRSRLAEAMAAFTRVSAEHDVPVFTFGHAGDGNLHPTLVTPHGDVDAAGRALRAFDAILDVALDLGGTVTGEHGVGLIKRTALVAELDEVAIDLHTRVKQAWDPRGILNPGKAVPLRRAR